MPQELGVPVQDASASEPPADAKVDSFLVNFVEPHFGHSAPFQLLERTRISLSASHCWQ
jgi:hypothetical protein